MNAKVAISAGVFAVVAIAVGLIIHFARKTDPPKKGATVLVELRPRPGDPESIQDPQRGRKIFEQNCVTCHGWRGEGNGPSDPYLWRRPRNLSDAGYMNVRTDSQIRRLINNGGADEELKLSRVMPSWSTTFNVLQQGDVLAWVRRLHPGIEEMIPGGDFTRFESVLTEARVGELKAKSGTEPIAGDGTVVFYAVWRDRQNRPLRVDSAAPAPDAAGLAGYVAFTRVDIGEGKMATLCLAIDPSKKVLKSSVFEQVTFLNGEAKDSTSVDALVKAFEGAGDGITGVTPPAITGRDEATATLSGAVKRLYFRILLGLDQDKEDWAAIAAGTKVNSDMPGYAVYDKMACAKCHGPTGRSKGPGVAQLEPMGANLADGVRMNALSDDYLTLLLEKGGIALLISSTMPEYGNQMTAQERKDLVAWMRSLATPKK